MTFISKYSKDAGMRTNFTVTQKGFGFTKNGSSRKITKLLYFSYPAGRKLWS